MFSDFEFRTSLGTYILLYYVAVLRLEILYSLSIPLRELARFWFPETRSISRGEAEGNRSGQGGQESC